MEVALIFEPTQPSSGPGSTPPMVCSGQSPDELAEALLSSGGWIGSPEALATWDGAARAMPGASRQVLAEAGVSRELVGESHFGFEMWRRPHTSKAARQIAGSLWARAEAMELAEGIAADAARAGAAAPSKPGPRV